MIVPAQIFVIDYYREVYKCKTCEELSDEAKIVKADTPVPVMKKSMASPATVAFIMTENIKMEYLFTGRKAIGKTMELN